MSTWGANIYKSKILGYIYVLSCAEINRTPLSSVCSVYVLMEFCHLRSKWLGPKCDDQRTRLIYMIPLRQSPNYNVGKYYCDYDLIIRRQLSLWEVDMQVEFEWRCTTIKKYLKKTPCLAWIAQWHKCWFFSLKKC